MSSDSPGIVMPSIQSDPVAELDSLLRAAAASYQQRRREKLFGDIPIVLASVPVWTESLAQRVLQANPTASVPSSFVEWLRAGLVQELKSPLREEQTPALIRFVMPAALRTEILTANADNYSNHPSRIWHLVRQVAQALSALTPAPGDPEETRDWANLMAAAADTRQLADLIDANIRNAQTSTEIYRIIEVTHAFEPLVWALQDSLDVSLLRSGRRLELLRRNDDDRMHLRNFLEREEQLAALDALIGADDEHWGLHFVGAGGVGKTMLLRHICSDYSIGRFAVSRVDFDYLNPDYPRLAPGLLLWAFGEGLRAYAHDSSFDGWMDQASGILLKLHEELRANLSGTPIPVIEHPHFKQALMYYTQALRSLSLRVLLILDTCEELARVSAGGSVPDNVRDTFQILEALHAGIPGLRVIFSGRRPLARSGYGWSCPSAPPELPERTALRLHEIRGFTHPEATRYLTDCKVSIDLHAPIIARSADVGRVVEVRWTDPTLTSPDVPRCNPYDLKLYAEWAREEPPPDADTIARSSAAQYVEFRIIGRLRHPLLERLLPIIAVLGHIDDHTLRELSGLASETDAFGRLQVALRQQEWTNVRSIADLEDGGVRHVYSVDPALCKRLRAYAWEHQANWRDLAQQAARYLIQSTSARDLSKLDWTDIEATLNVLDIEADAVRAAQWWEVMASRLRERDPQWRIDLLKFLCVSDAAAAAPEPEPTSLKSLLVSQRLRPAILGVYADAVMRMGHPSRSDRHLWAEVFNTAARYPLAPEATRLRIAAAAGQLTCSDPLPDIEDLETLQTQLLRVNEQELDQNTTSILIGVAEGALDRMDLYELNGPRCGAQLDRAMVELMAVICSFFVAPEESGLPFTGDLSDQSDAIAWTRCLRARAFARMGERDLALRDFDLALRRARVGRESARLHEEAMLHHSRLVRIRLEFARIASPLLGPPTAVLSKILAMPALPVNIQLGERPEESIGLALNGILSTADPQSAPLCVERLASVGLRLVASLRPLDSVSDIQNLELALRVKPRMGVTAAERIVPPLCCVAAEELAATGRVDEAVSHLRALLYDSSQLHEEIRREIERAYLRIALKFRLFEMGEGTVDSLRRTVRFSDWELQYLARALTPKAALSDLFDKSAAADRITVYSHASLIEGDYLHARWRALGPPPPDLTQEARRAFLEQWRTELRKNSDADTEIDLLECQLVLGIPLQDSQRSTPDRELIDESTCVRRLREYLLRNTGPPLKAWVDEMCGMLGKRRSAGLILEEATALGLRLPYYAKTLALCALELFQQLGDCVGALQAALVGALSDEPSVLNGVIPLAAFFNTEWRKKQPGYAGIGSQGSVTFAMVENLPVVKALDRLGRSTELVTSRWRPLLFRWVLVRAAAAAQSPDNLAYLSTLTALYPQSARILEQSEFRLWVPEKETAQPPPESSARSILAFLRQPSVVVACIILVLLAMAIWLGRQPGDSRPDPSVQNLGGAAQIDESLQIVTLVALFTLATAFLWRQWRVPRWLRRLCKVWTIFSLSAFNLFCAALLLPGTDTQLATVGLLVAGPYGLWRLYRYLIVRAAIARPIRVTVRVRRVAERLGSITSGPTTVSLTVAHVSPVFIPRSAQSDLKDPIECALDEVDLTQSYRDFAHRLRPDLCSVFARMRLLPGLRRVDFDFVSDTPEAHAWPLEAAVLLNTPLRIKSLPTPADSGHATFIPSVRAAPFRFRRSVAMTQARPESFRPASLLRGSKVELHPQVGVPMEALGQSWRRHAFPWTAAPGRATRILHLVGIPREDSSGLQFRLLADPADRPQTATALRCEEIIDTYPDLSLCIFQRAPSTPQRRRTDIDRREAAMMRVLAASLFARGVPLVITLPSLERSGAVAIVDIIARYAAANGLRDRDAFVQMLDDTRHSIAKSFPGALELSASDILDPQRVAKYLTREGPRSRIAAALTPPGRKDLERWKVLPVESLTGLLVSELNPILRSQDLARLAPLRERARILWPWLLRPWMSKLERNRTALAMLFPGCFTDGAQVARTDAWETTLDVCGFCAPPNH